MSVPLLIACMKLLITATEHRRIVALLARSTVYGGIKEVSMPQFHPAEQLPCETSRNMGPQREDEQITRTCYCIWAPFAFCFIFSSWLATTDLLASPSTADSGTPVRFNQETLFTIQTGLGDFDSASRAAAIEKRLDRLAHAPDSSIPELAVEDQEHTSYIVTPDEVLLVVTEADAKASGHTRQELAETYASRIRTALVAARPVQPVVPAHLVGVEELISATIASALVIALMVAFRFGFPRLYRLLESWRGTRLRGVSVGGMELLSSDLLTDLLLLLSRTLRTALALAAFFVYIQFVVGLFPWALSLEADLYRTLSAPLEHSQGLRSGLGALFFGLALTLFATGVFLASLKILQQLFPRLTDWIAAWGRTSLPTLKVQRVELLSAEQLTDGLLGILQAVRFLALAFLIYFYASSVLGFFPWTRQLSFELFGHILRPVYVIGGVFADSIPNLIAIVMIVLVTRYLLKLIALFFRGLERGAIRFTGFHQDWAKPTYGIVRFLVIVFAAIACFPYIPGSQSEGFRGISVFLGLLISLGSAAAIGNMIAGVVLTYMRPFQLGDRVKIADTVGDVAEKTLLVTRIRTIKNVDITIPNSLILAAHIVNYSSAALSPPPLILNTTITIGYDTPWRTVHELLKKAASGTRNILSDPEPFVLQTALNDFYVSYEINAYTGAANQMAVTYSELYQNIQDAFNEAGVEIMSPHYSQLRDGNKTAVPDQYLPKQYEVPGLRITPLGKWTNQPNDGSLSRNEAKP